MNLPINVIIKIFDLNGNLIKIIRSENMNQLFNSIFWDGLDSSNQKIPNGSYIIHIKTISNYAKINRESKHNLHYWNLSKTLSLNL